MKIVQVIPSFEIAGAEIMCENLIYELKSLGHEVIVLSMYSYKSAITERLENAGISIKYLDKKPGLDLSMFKKIKQVLRDEKPDVVHTHLYVTKYVFPIASSMGIKVIHTIHTVASKDSNYILRKLDKQYFKSKKVLPVALSGLIRDSVVAEYGIQEEDVPIIFNGINLSRCRIKNEYNYKEKFVILHIGRFSELKNHQGLLEAFNIFHKKFPDSELWLIGDGEEKEKALKYVENQNLQERVKFLGLQDNVYGFLNSADIFTLPSHYEGIPMTLIEAMGTGLPIVATRVGGIPDMLDDSSAILVSTDVREIAQAFERYYMSEDLRKAHGTKALVASEKFSANEMAVNYLKVYNKAVNNNGK